MSAVSERFTIDTNLLVYSVDSTAGVRREIAAEILARALRLDCWLTLQALSEFYVATTRKRIAPPAEAAALVTDWLDAFPTVGVTRGAIRAALGYAAVGRASYWDALLIATAAEAGCTVILTEDLAHGDELGGVEIHNPFAGPGGLTERAGDLLGLA
ncbi:MAG TPA: PIN domain-containing protein [Stellaceae bacterium]|nr:PIN domain-containing protein [Stellaceae bacterium]